MDNIFCGLMILIFLLAVSFAKIGKIGKRDKDYPHAPTKLVVLSVVLVRSQKGMSGNFAAED